MQDPTPDGLDELSERVAIAVGWQKAHGAWGAIWMPPSAEAANLNDGVPPDYANDERAILAEVRKLDATDRGTFACTLARVVHGQGCDEAAFIHGIPPESAFDLITATARQLCEAFIVAKTPKTP